MNRLRRWWHNHRQSQATIHARMARIETSLEQLARQISIHALATDTRLSVYDVLIPKTLVDLNAGLQVLAETQRRLADLMERRDNEAAEGPRERAATRNAVPNRTEARPWPGTP